MNTDGQYYSNKLPNCDEDVNFEHCDLAQNRGASEVFSAVSSVSPTFDIFSPNYNGGVLVNPEPHGLKSKFLPSEKKSGLKGSFFSPTVVGVKISSKSSRYPEKPSFVVRTHVIVYKILADIIKKTETALDNFAESLSRTKFDEDLYMWTAVNARGSSYCKFEVRIYSNHDSKNGFDGLIVEANRLQGDAGAFFPIYNEIKSALLEEPRVERRMDSFSNSFPAPAMHEPLSDSEATEALTPIIRMAEEKSDTSRKESARIFCDLSQNDTVQEQLAKNGCIPVLAELARSDNECTKRNAIFALSNLSATQTPKINSEIIGTGILSTLLTLATNGPYHDKQMRRAAAAILNNISKQFPDEVVSSIGKEKLHEWMRTVVDIEDSQLQTHAVKAKEYLAQRAVVV